MISLVVKRLEKNCSLLLLDWMLLSLVSKESRFVGAWEANISIYYRSIQLQRLEVGS